MAFVLISFGSASCKKSNDTSPADNPGPNEVFMKDNLFTPNNLTVKLGTTVKWTNKGAITHTATSNDGGATFNSGNVTPGQSFSYTTTTAGTFQYQCTIHGAAMSGTLTVTP